MMAWIYLTPIMYDVDFIPEQLRTLFFINPMTPVIVVYHDILYYRVIPSSESLLQAVLVSLAIFAVGFLLFWKLDQGFAEEL